MPRTKGSLYWILSAIRDLPKGSQVIIDADQKEVHHYIAVLGLYVTTKIVLVVEDYKGEDIKVKRMVQVTRT